MSIRKYRVFGRVQGVGFRFFVRYTANAFGLSGYVENLPDGSVAVVARGSVGQLDALEAALREGPRWSAVERVIREPVEEPGQSYSGFIIR